MSVWQAFDKHTKEGIPILKSPNEPFYESVCFAVSNPDYPSNVHAQPSSGARSATVFLKLHIVPNILSCMKSKGSGETAQIHRLT